jgi:ABC-type glycerol-3-phosphate transport system permease component
MKATEENTQHVNAVEARGKKANSAPAPHPFGSSSPHTASSGLFGNLAHLKLIRHLWIYILLISGSVVFIWPFLWMATTSLKLDREVFMENLSLWPQAPEPAVKSPYVDERYFDGFPDHPRMEDLLPALEAYLRDLDYPWPTELDREILIKQTARGVFNRLVQLIPPESLSDSSLDVLKAEALSKINDEIVQRVVDQIRRHLSIGRLVLRSYDFAEDEVVSASNVESSWKLGGNALGQLVSRKTGTPKAPIQTDLHYDFSKGDLVELHGSFTTTFPIDRLHRIQLSLGSDNTWHKVDMQVEMKGALYRSDESRFLSDFFDGRLIDWQEPGPDDRALKAKIWTHLREVARGSEYLDDPHKIKITLQLQKNTSLGAWWAKFKRNYALVLDHIPFWRYVGTSLFLVILNIVCTLFSCSLVAYSFARLQWPGRGFCFTLMLATMMIPSQVTMIPNFLIMRNLGLYNTLFPLWIDNLFAGAFNVFLLRQFLKGIPRDLEDAARIDGCGFLRVYWHIMLPLIKPTLAAIAIFTFMSTWNDFMGPLIYLSDQRLYPLSFGLYALNVEEGGSMGIMMAAALLMTLPIITIFFFAQRYFIQGITLTGMKG